MSKSRRLELIESIEKGRNSYVITYVLSDRPNAMGRLSPDAVREIYNLLCQLKPIDRKKRLDLFVYGTDGDNNVPWQIVAMIREMFDHFSVIVPYKAHGAATMIALGADTIIMGEKGELSSIEVSVRTPHNPNGPGAQDELPVSVQDVEGLVYLLERLGRVREKQRIDAFLRTIDKIPPLLLGSVNRTLEQTKMACMKLLQSRRRPFRNGRNRRIVGKLFPEFSWNRQCISVSEAIKEIGLKQVNRVEELEPIFWELLTLYEKELRTSHPFYPEEVMEQSDEEEKVFPNQKLVYMETTRRTRVFQRDVKVKKIRRYPPDVQFNPQVVLPSFEIAPEMQVSEYSVLDFVQQWLQNNLPGIVNGCFDKFKNEFPVTAYDCLHLNQRWTHE